MSEPTHRAAFPAALPDYYDHRGISKTRWQGFTIAELSVVYDSLLSAKDGFILVLNQPRCSGQASSFLEDEDERLSDLLSGLVYDMVRRQPRAGEESARWARVVVDWLQWRCDEPGDDFVALARKIAEREISDYTERTAA